MTARKLGGGPGAPRKKASEAKGRVVQLRVTPAHKRLLAEAARERGLSLSSWMLSVALDAAKAQKTKA